MHEKRSRDRFELEIPVTVHEVDDAGHVTRMVQGTLNDVSRSGHSVGLMLLPVPESGTVAQTITKLQKQAA